jgi:hypothetical protein
LEAHLASFVTAWLEEGEAEVEVEVEVDVVVVEVVLDVVVVEDVEALQEPKAGWHPAPQ